MTSPVKTAICTLDELVKQKFDYRTCIFVAPKPLVERRILDYYDCADILTRLRAPDGCPWDREQTHKSIVKNVIEEAYELANALENDDTPNVVEELGDLLLTVTSLARKLGVDSERALSRATDKFIDRFERVEQEAEAMGKHPSELSMTELDAIWDRIKHEKM